MRSYCTLFDHSYLSRGLVMYESLFRYEKDAQLFILAMDDICFRKLSSLDLKHAVIIRSSDFEGPQLKKLKQERGHAEYCWTCSSFLIEYVLDHYGTGMCTYLDADICFFNSPELLFEEMGGNAVLITPHNFSDYCDCTKESGKYCVQFLPFCDDDRGRRILSSWKNKCIQCCEMSPERGYCGDQKYLDEWSAAYEGVCETACLGAGVAPWNVERFLLFYKDGHLMLKDRRTEEITPVIFYHFHQLVLFDKDVVRLTHTGYHISPDAVDMIYAPYLKMIKEIHKQYHLEPEIDYNGLQHYRDTDLRKLGKNYCRLSSL